LSRTSVLRGGAAALLRCRGGIVKVRGARPAEGRGGMHA
jgi:hypothetical protein